MSTEKPQTQMPLLYTEELNQLNARWNTLVESEKPRGIFGRITHRLAKRLISSVLEPYLAREREFLMHLVQYLNNTARYIDARDKEVFWQLINKVDNEIGGVHERVDLLIAQLTEEDKRLQRLFEATAMKHDERLEQISLQVRRIEKLSEQLRYFIEELEKKSLRITKALCLNE